MELYHRLHYPDSKQCRAMTNNMTSSLLDTYQRTSKRPSGVLAERYGEHISNCSVTVFFMDPRLSHPIAYGQGQPGWYALESVAAYIPTACVFLLTASCTMQSYIMKQQEASSSSSSSTSLVTTKQVVDEAVRDAVYAKSLPLFRNMMDQGLVRLSYLDHNKYHFESCSNTGNPTTAFVNIGLWRDEFIEQDSDSVLVIQDDSVFCYSHDLLQGTSILPQYQQYPYVGGVWPRDFLFLRDMCMDPQDLWRRFLWEEKNRRKGDGNKQQEQQHWNHRNVSTEISLCGQQGRGPIGNGGLSLRSRKWMIRAIEACPFEHYSGIQNISALTTRPICMAKEYNREDDSQCGSFTVNRQAHF